MPPNRFVAAATLLLTMSSPGARAVGAPASDRVTALPGWEGELPSAHYSGYVAVAGGTKQLHYYLQEADSDAESKPLVLWCALLQLSLGHSASGTVDLLAGC